LYSTAGATENTSLYPLPTLTKSEVYLEALPLFTQGTVDLLDYQPLTVELMQLERRTRGSGRDAIDHPPGGHDDHANAACGTLVLCAQADRHWIGMVKFTGF
jgi:hypothetical protein